MPTRVVLTSRLPQIAARASAGAEAQERATSERVAARMRADVAVDTGATRDSIRVTDKGVEVGGAALYLEYGTHDTAAQPFLLPAVEAERAPFLGRLAALFR